MLCASEVLGNDYLEATDGSVKGRVVECLDWVALLVPPRTNYIIA
jgi:hypothetical protein